MKLISWNVNGIRACLQKGFEDAFRTLNADFFCLQETKLSEGQQALELLHIRLPDHIIIADRDYVSMADSGLIDGGA